MTAIDRTRFRLPSSQYFQQVYPKDLIVLHFTAGATAAGAHAAWLQSPVPVATAYIVDLNGAIYEIFDPKYWAYHLGIRGVANANWKHDRRSIGIEIVNVGPLRPDPKNPDQLNWWPPSGEYKAAWCTRRDTTRYVQEPYRGFDYFASFPQVQMASLKELVGSLCQTFNIPVKIPAHPRRTEFNPAFFAAYQGIAAHQNFRDDKVDIGPAFDWHLLG